ncbi:MAG: hypothetical protein IJP95_00280, partial [Bacteroidales bacterium]|nr:hypothetical protein [Bacteroidales bacterium]
STITSRHEHYCGTKAALLGFLRYSGDPPDKNKGHQNAAAFFSSVWYLVDYSLKGCSPAEPFSALSTMQNYEFNLKIQKVG